MLAWPAPPSVGYATPPNLGEPEPCELEGPNGKVNSGLLVGVDPDAGQVQVLIPPARHLLTLRFTQFRRLSLTRPLEPLPAADSLRMDATTPLLPQNLLQPYRLCFKDGTEATICSIGLVDKPLGLFTFSPMDASGRLLRSLYPRPMLASVQVAPAGAAPLADDDQDTTPLALDELPGAHAPQPPKAGDMLSGAQITTADPMVITQIGALGGARISAPARIAPNHSAASNDTAQVPMVRGRSTNCASSSASSVAMPIGTALSTM
jgi:hypothetical protein